MKKHDRHRHMTLLMGLHVIFLLKIKTTKNKRKIDPI